MLRTSLLCAGFALVFTVLWSDTAFSPHTSQVGLESSAPIAQASANGALPIRVAIPSIGLDAPVTYMGIDTDGNMDVPESRSSQVGWYKDGTVPGQTGSAVFDAHVVSAFRNLHYIRPGEDIFVTTANDKILHFKVAEIDTYKVGNLSPDLLFNRDDAKRLNLITCAGVNLGHGNYSKRFVAYAVLVEDEN